MNLFALIPTIVLAAALLLIAGFTGWIGLARYQLRTALKVAGLTVSTWREGKTYYGYTILTEYPIIPTAHDIIMAEYSNKNIMRGVVINDSYPVAAQHVRYIMSRTYCGLYGDFLLYYQTAGISIASTRDLIRNSWRRRRE